MKRAVFVAAALLTNAGCSGQQPTFEAVAPHPPTCTDWSSGAYQHDSGAVRRLLGSTLPTTDTAPVAVALSTYCARYPDDDLGIAAGLVTVCLWPDRTQYLRGPDCTGIWPVEKAS